MVRLGLGTLFPKRQGTANRGRHPTGLRRLSHASFRDCTGRLGCRCGSLIRNGSEALSGTERRP